MRNAQLLIQKQIFQNLKKYLLPIYSTNIWNSISSKSKPVNIIFSNETNKSFEISIYLTLTHLMLTRFGTKPKQAVLNQGCFQHMIIHTCQTVIYWLSLYTAKMVRYVNRCHFILLKVETDISSVFAMIINFIIEKFKKLTFLSRRRIVSYSLSDFWAQTQCKNIRFFRRPKHPQEQ